MNAGNQTLVSVVNTTNRVKAVKVRFLESLPFSEIAFLVGYSELSAFSRAVRRWTGQSPRSLRKSLAVP